MVSASDQSLARDSRERRLPHALQEHAEAFSRLADAGSQVVCVTELEPARVVYVSPSFEAVWGRSPREFQANPGLWLESVHPDDRDAVRRAFGRYAAREGRQIEYRVVQPDGSLRWVSDHGVVTLDARGRAAKLCRVSTDITELKLAEQDRVAHLKFLDSLDRIQRTIQGASHLEQLLGDVLEMALEILSVERAWLAFPCEADNPAWRTTLERQRRPTLAARDQDHAELPGTCLVLDAARARQDVIDCGPGSALPVPEDLERAFGVRGMLCVPLHPKVGARYVLGVHRCAPERPWSERERRLFRELGRRVSEAIATLWTVRGWRESERRLEDEQRRAPSRVERLFSAQQSVNRLLAGSANIDEVGVPLLRALSEELSWDLAVLWRTDEGAQRLQCRARWSAPGVPAGAFEAVTQSASLAAGEGLPGLAWSSRAPGFFRHLSRDADLARRGAATQDGFRTALAFPILVASGVWGVVELVAREPHDREPHLLEALATMGRQIGQFVEHSDARAALQQAREQLAHLARVTTLGDRTASIAHEVNQPLTGIIANADAALRWLDRSPPEVDEALLAIRRLERDGKRAGEVVSRLTALARKNGESNRSSVDVNQLIRETLLLVHSELLQHEVAVELSLQSGLAIVAADRVQLQQVLLNLLSNGLEALQKVSHPRRLSVRSSELGSRGLSIRVVDNAGGVPEAHGARIFEPYFSTKPGGLGMGLAISRTLVEEHGGTLEVTSSEAGSTFELRLSPVER